MNKTEFMASGDVRLRKTAFEVILIFKTKPVDAKKIRLTLDRVISRY